MDRQSTPRGDGSQPRWMRNKRWSSGVIRDQSSENLIALWIFTLAWNVVTCLALIPHVKEFIHGREYSRLIGLVFPAIGVALLVWAVRRTRRITKFGDSVFHLQTLPATPGGDLAGTIHVARRFQAESGVQLKLLCINRFMTGFGRRARLSDSVIWHETHTHDQIPLSQDGTDIPVMFHIPPDAQPSSDLELGDGVRWRLEVRCKTMGVNYFSRFEVPVFIAAPSELAAAYRRVASTAGAAESADSASEPSERGITFERLAGGRLRINFDAARNKASLVFSILIALALVAVAIGLGNWSAGGFYRYTAICCAIVVLVVGAVFDIRSIFNWMFAEEITVRYGSLTAERQGPMYHQEQTFKLGDVSDVFYKVEGRSSSVSGGVNKKKYHSLMLETRDGVLVRLARDIVQKDYAAWLAQEIKDALGVATVR